MEMNLTLGVKDLEQSKLFYRNVLGLSPSFFSMNTAEDAYFILYFTNIKVVFQQLDTMENQHPALLQNLTRAPLGLGVQLELNCANLDELEIMIRHHDWPIVYELDDQEHRRRELWVQDPDGYLVVLNAEQKK
ncbi:MAG: VOC family protein [Deltaproteobacteria bacterium]|jgi:catechol 2,3-dioxygenase-like lactoylglutathione lyase family enzyme|nr:VOC family protein [Deltaproteobacteria bacterium]MCW8892027.1 VOC family protein [Deltaproteobacteria bacterium]MCW9049667.1 VOC family protein [Deltaproteobacteria bacterium]